MEFDWPPLEEEHLVKPKPGLAKKELSIGLIMVALLFGVTLISQKSPTGFFIGPSAVQETATEEITEVQTEENGTNEEIMSEESTLMEESSPDNPLTGMAVKTEENPAQMLYASNQFAGNKRDLTAIMESATQIRSMVFNGKKNEYAYTQSTELKSLSKVLISFLAKEDFVYNPSEWVTGTLLLYNGLGELVQTQTFSYNQQEILIQESATGVTILSNSMINEGEWRRVELEIELVQQLGISSLVLMFLSDSSEDISEERHVFIDEVTMSVF